MSTCLRRPSAACLLLLLAALWLAPVGAVCSHASDSSAELATEHQHDGGPAHAGDTVATTSSAAEPPASSCPMEGQTGCSAPATLPNRTIVYQIAPTAEWGPYLAAALDYPDTERPPIFHPPKA